MIRRLCLGAGLVAAALAGSGCSGDTGTGDEVRGETLTVYVSAPLHGPRGAEGQDVVDGAKLALAGAGGKAGELEVQAVYFDDTSEEAEGWDPVVTADNARQAAEDTTAIAYIGDLDSGATRTSLPITNQAEMLHLSPGSTAVELTRTPPGGGPRPERFQPSEQRTFIRLPPADDVQAEAAALLAKQIGFRAVGVVNDRSDFGKAIATAFKRQSQDLGLDVGGAGRPDADSLYLAGTAEGLGKSAFAARPVPAIASDALLSPPDLAFRVASGPAPAYFTASLIEPFRTKTLGERRFPRDFQEQYGRQPGPAAAYGYEAMSLVLDAIRRAGDDGDSRSRVIDEAFATRGREAVIGTYSVQDSGDTTLDEITVYRVAGDRLTFDREIEAP